MTSLSGHELAAIARVMADSGTNLAGPLVGTLIAKGRSNLTFRLSDGTREWVLRTPPRVGRTPSAHDVAREFRVTSALSRTEVPVPPAVALCEDHSLIGGPFAIAEFVDGRSIQSRQELDALDDSGVAGIVEALMTTLAALHRVDHVSAGLERFGRPDRYADRQLSRWAGQWDLVADDSLTPLVGEIVHRLRKQLPRQSATGIVHGDFRIDNTLLDIDARPIRIAAVVDWELSTIGDPVADLAMMCAYRDPAFDLIVGSPSAWTSPRLPDAEDLAAEYERAGGVELDDWESHLALAYFKIAVIAAGIAHRARLGASAGPGFDTAAKAVLPFLTCSHAALGLRQQATIA